MNRFSSVWTLVLAAAFGLWAQGSARAVIVSAVDNSRYLVAPDDDPGWSNMGILAGGTAVYLGDNWILTANHVSVSGGTVLFTDGRSFSLSPQSAVRLRNSGGPQPDLRMWQLIGDVGLPSISIAEKRPALLSSVVMIGSGQGRLPGLKYWNIDAAQQWTETTYSKAEAIGFKLDTSGNDVMAWGVNKVVRLNQSFANTVAFSTVFNQFAVESAGQATSGDSGGGVFIRENGDWKLTGIILADTPLVGQDFTSAVYGQETIIAQLADYRSQIIATLALSPWQNQLNNLDVTRNGTVTISDALIVKNALLKLEAGDDGTLTGRPDADDFLLDVDGDHKLGALDLLRIRNRLLGILIAAPIANSLAALPDDFETNDLAVPEPTGFALALGGATVLCAIVVICKRRTVA